MSTSNYITSTDITTTVAQDFNLSGYIDRVNNDLEYLASTLGLTPTDINTPIHYMLKEYGIAQCNKFIYRDKIGSNNDAEDKYLVLYDLYKRESDTLRRELTTEIVNYSGNLSANETVGSTIIYRI